VVEDRRQNEQQREEYVAKTLMSVTWRYADVNFNERRSHIARPIHFINTRSAWGRTVGHGLQRHMTTTGD